MTNAFSTKFRTIGGASMLALSTGLVTAPAAAQSAPQPVASFPTQTPPAAPGNAEECALVDGAVVCAPGTDADGFAEATGAVTVSVEEGALVQGEINLLDDVTATIDGAVIATGGANAIDLGEGAIVVNNGFLSADPLLDGIVSVDSGSSVTNNGTIFSDGGDVVGGIVTGGPQTIVNNGLIALRGNGSAGIIGNFPEAGPVSVTNSVSGSIIIERTAGGTSFGILTGDDATITNDGLVQTFGATAIAIAVGSDSSVTNNGFVVTDGDQSIAIQGGSGVTVINSGSGRILTSGNDLGSVAVGEESLVQNNGLISSTGDNAPAVIAGDGSTVVNNPTGQILTTGERSNAVVIQGEGRFINAGGLIEATGVDSEGVDIAGDAIFDNSGTIVSEQDRAVDIGGVTTLNNLVDGVISGLGSDGIRIGGDGSVIFNAGLIESDGDEAIEAADVNDVRVVNTGTIRTGENGDKAIEANANLRVENSGLIESAVSEAIEADAAGLVLINSGEIIARFDDAVDGDDNVTIMNSGLIQGGQNDGLELNSGFIMNSGTIESIDSDPDGSLIIGGDVPELDAGIDFDAGTDGNEDGIVYNLESGLIIGDIGINTSQGNQDAPDTNDGEQIVYNFGTITGRGENPANEGRIDAVLLGNGDDAFVKLNGGVENGVVDGQAGTDIFAFIITDNTDRSFDISLLGAQYLGFEDVRLGSQTFDYIGGTTQAPVAGGVMTLTGEGEQGFTVVNTAILEGSANGGITLIAGADEGIARSFTITADGVVDGGENGITVESDGFTITNDGSISGSTDAINTDSADDLTVFNNGTIAGGDDGIDGSSSDGLTVTNTGTINADDRGITTGDGFTLTNSGTIEAVGRAVDAGDDADITNDVDGVINTTGDDDTIQTGDSTMIVNNGTISNEGFDTKIIDAGDNLTVINNGTITSDWKGIEGEADFTLTNNEGGLIFSAFDEAVEADGPGLTVVNDGEIIAPEDDAIDGGADVTITNTGLIRGGENDGLELDSGTIVNSGIIESLSSDPDGDFSDAGLVNRELDAGIDFDGVDDPETLEGPETDTVTNLAGGIIRGDIGINASSGNFIDDGEGGSVPGSPANVRSQTIVNFGTIEGRIVNPVTGRIDAVLLSFGDDVFQQWQTGVTNGTVDGEDGDDTLIFGNDAEGTSTRDLDEISDPDNYTGFETYGLLDIGGALALTGTSGIEFSILGGDIILDGTLTGTISADGEGTLTVTEDGLIETIGADAVEVDVDGFTINNDGTIRSFGERAIDARDVDGTVINNTGLIVSAGEFEAPGEEGEGGDILTPAEVVIEVTIGVGPGSDAIDVSGSDGVTINNSGSIIARANDTKAIDGGENLTVINSGIIRSMNGDGKGIEGNAGLTVINEEGGLIEALGQGAEAVEDDDGGLTLVNSGTIRSEFDDAVDGNNDADITNNATGLIQGNDNDGLELDSGVVTNFGIIESLGSDPEGDFSDIDLTNRELDAGIDFDGGGNDADSTVMNMAGGIIRGDIGINASSGNFVDDGEGGGVASSPANFGKQTVVNFGTITANAVNPVTGRMDAVLLSFGDDEFQQWSGAVVNGWIDLEAGNDLFILEGTSSSVTGGISGGEGDDTAILAGTLDSDNFSAFETYQLGSTLGGSLNDLVIDGNRSLDGDVVHVGTVFVDLGVDSLTTTGSITLAETGTLTIGTPLDEALLGQTVIVFQDGTGFTNEGATVNILDDDQLLDYVPVVGSFAVQVNAANPIIDSTDGNLVTIGNALVFGLNEGLLSQSNFDTFNDLPSADAVAEALAGTLPSLSEGMGREIFETSNLASAALDRHLMSKSSGVWGQIAVRGAEQDSLSDTADGYESDQLVFTVGADLMFGDALRLGVLASYADIDTQDLRGDTVPTENNQAESIKLGVYASANFAERGFVNAEFAYLTGEIESRRDSILGPIASNYDFDGFVVRGVAGFDLTASEKVWITPTVGVNAARINFDDVAETGGFGFTVERGDAEFVELRGGLEIGGTISDTISGFASGTIIHDLIDTPRSFRLTSTQLGTFFANLPMREQNRYEIAAGLSVAASESFTIDVGYLGDFNDGYAAHSARATARVSF